MKRREFMTSAVAGVAGLAASVRMSAQLRVVTPDLARLVDRNELHLFRRSASRLTDGGKMGVRLSEGPGDGAAFLPGIDFANGTIEIDLRGRNVPQRSFIGVAFHGTDLAECDAIYFRPFNFRAADPLGRSHAVQYHSMPANGWQKLRTEQPGRFEQPVTPTPDPDNWFRARIVVADPSVSVYVGDAREPSLQVTLLNQRKRGGIGLWVGNNSRGDFANLTIAPA